MSQPQKRKQPSQNKPQDPKQQPQSSPTPKPSLNPQQPPLTKPPQKTRTQPLPQVLPPIKRGWEWYKSINSPRLVLSPMVGQSELTFRQLLRTHGAQLTYTPMIISSQYLVDPKYRSAVFTYDTSDRPLVVQLCATNSKDFISAAQLILKTHQIDAIELNLGCPQGVAERGGYGSWMMEDLPNIQQILTAAVQILPIPITAKIRIFPTLSQTLQYTQMLANCGISLLTVHPRQRHHREEFLACWDVVSAIRAQINIPVVLNGDIWGPSDLAMAFCLNPVDGFMCAQGALQMPSIFKTISQFVDYNRPQPQSQEEAENEGEKQSTDAKDKNGKNKRQKTTTSTNTNGTESTSKPPTTTSTSTVPSMLPEQLPFQSTQCAPFLQPKTCNYWRIRKFLNTSFFKSKTLPESSKTMTKGNNPAQTQTSTEVQIPINTRIESIYDELSSTERSNYHSVIKSYNLTPLQLSTFQSNPMHVKFVSVILHLEAQIDPCKRQLQNAVEYIRMVEQYPVHHHSIAQRHLFFILFDLVNKHIDCYDLLYVATDVAAYKAVIHKLHQKAIAGVDFQGCDKDNWFAKHNKERNRRRDGTLSPPSWPVGGGGFNVACTNGSGGKDAVGGGKSDKKMNDKLKVDLSKFD